MRTDASGVSGDGTFEKPAAAFFEFRTARIPIFEGCFSLHYDL
jgi:hypothetical protein